MSSDDYTEPVTFVDNRKIDPETGEVRDADAVPEPLAGTGTAPQPGAFDEDVEIVEAVAPKADELAERTADLQRLSAEYANYRRRADREKQAAREAGKVAVLTDLLGVIDDLERARAHGDLETGPLKSVSAKLAALLEKQGVTEFGNEGDLFDPTLHEAVQHDGEGHDPVLGAVLRKGYRSGERVLRHAMVTVTDKSDTVGTAEVGSESDSVDPTTDADAGFEQR
ncbi:nucleotide exchange factor GrpE [Antrihabitans sp. YC2-6]|uniref:nucleotide exchange factor GrpE n=1 Tax=Antrihabitans sp. YC2-6 TaxID=2799498 RepID=UPI0018F3C016|nr:nucleotide exchange factor GrpE [Antrihabitans sp. YC2-6]MBJ8348691.1 nucleotide exchange factor GrpE [Antrihabitans sp. YC2-6]